MEEFDVVIIGGGVSAMAAAIYSGRFDLKTLVLGKSFGGTIILTDEIANYPGFSSITGANLAKKIQKHAEDYNVDLREEEVTDIKRCENGCIKILSSKSTYKAKAVILATGTKWRKLNVLGEEDFANRGVHYCALCDGPLYRDKIVGVVGGSDSAAKEAVLLSKYAKKVYIFVKGEKLLPEPINLKLVNQTKNIEVVTNISITEIKGDFMINKIILDKEFNGSKEFSVDGLFINVGNIPLSDLAIKLGIDTNEKGEVVIDKESRTSLKNFFAAGDVTDVKFKQAITGVGSAVTAAYSAYQSVIGEEIKFCNDLDFE